MAHSYEVVSSDAGPVSVVCRDCGETWPVCPRIGPIRVVDVTGRMSAEDLAYILRHYRPRGDDS